MRVALRETARRPAAALDAECGAVVRYLDPDFAAAGYGREGERERERGTAERGRERHGGTAGPCSSPEFVKQEEGILSCTEEKAIKLY